MGCCLSFLSRLRPSAVTRRERTDSWANEDEQSAWAFLERVRQEEEEESQLERERQDLDAQEFLAGEGNLPSDKRASPPTTKGRSCGPALGS